MRDQLDVLVGRRLKRRRRLQGLSPQQLGDACGLSFAQVQKYEAGDARLSVDVLWAFACVLEVDVGYFFVDVPRAVPRRQDEAPGDTFDIASRA